MTQKIIYLLISLILIQSCQEGSEHTEQNPKDSLRQQIKVTENAVLDLKKERITNILGFAKKHKIFNGSVLVKDEGKILLKEHYGVENFKIKKIEPINQKSRYRICSISKQFTAMAIMLLAERGELSYEDDIRKYIHQLSDYEGITIKHLLTHTSGLPDYITHFYSISDKMTTYASNQDILNWLTENFPKLHFSSGTKWEYSNTGYVLLAFVIENISGQSYEEFLQDNIFKKLNMKNCILPKYQNTDKFSNKVIGFKFDNKTLDDDNFLNYIYGDGGLYMSLDDLEKWEDGLSKNKLLPKESIKKAFRPTKLSNGSLHNYGFGWHLDKKNPKEMFHFGQWLGFRTLIYRIPETDSCIIILNNNQSPAVDILYKIIYQIIKKEGYAKWIDELNKIPKK